MMERVPQFTIVVLTYNRKEVLAELLQQLDRLARPDAEVVVVDNCSSDGTNAFVRSAFPRFTLVLLEENRGAVGRNWGMAIARGEYVITIDDDILGLDGDALDTISARFTGNAALGALCFRVVDHYTGQVCNWCHPRDPELHGRSSFETNEITEGAVAFRREMLDRVGLYPEDFFISHEGADLAARIIDNGFEIHYSPRVTVSHKYARNARPGWRRYYYDTRNDFWLAVRNYRPVAMALHLMRRLPATFVYAVRDGFFHYWLKAVRDALLHLPEILKQRQPISREAHRKLRLLNRERPGIAFYLKRRLFARVVKL
ncbi:glycosyltransferase [Geotalea sp. SG265]|uniref:glycosyltransferase family 2 protein n=1 Tax=Geotalea sp. SG265 TaxID=2922867 RepID=UPI001FAF1CFD|nr:glycosyltransferase [Geotalea sp. SG265]